MGELADAIRDHLELKRRRGADPAEVAREEEEALAPVTRSHPVVLLPQPELDEAPHEEPFQDEPFPPEPESSEPEALEEPELLEISLNGGAVPTEDAAAAPEEATAATEESAVPGADADAELGDATQEFFIGHRDHAPDDTD